MGASDKSDQVVSAVPVTIPSAEQAVMVCPQCEGEGGYPDGMDEAACHTECTRCGSNGWIVDLVALAAIAKTPTPPVYTHAYNPHRKYPWFCADCGYPEHERLKHPAQAIEARRAETQGGSVHESAVGNADAPNTSPERRTP